MTSDGFVRQSKTSNYGYIYSFQVMNELLFPTFVETRLLADGSVIHGEAKIITPANSKSENSHFAWRQTSLQLECF